MLYVKGDVGLLQRPRSRSSARGRRRRPATSWPGSSRASWGGRVSSIASGLARGIDAAAHEGGDGDRHGGVLAGGIDFVYPPEHAALAADRRSGCLLTEMRRVSSRAPRISRAATA